MSHREPIILPIDHHRVFAAERQVSVEELQARMRDEAEKRKKEWDNQMERLRRQLFRSVLKEQKTAANERRAHHAPSGSATDESESFYLNYNTGEYAPSYPGRRAGAPSPPPRADLIDDLRDFSEIRSTQIHSHQHSASAARSTSPQEVSRDFCVKFDMREYRPEHITVQVKGTELFVQASCEEVRAGSRSLKEFKKKTTLPKDVDPDALVSRYSPDGTLTVEVPRCPYSTPRCSPTPPASQHV